MKWSSMFDFFKKPSRVVEDTRTDLDKLVDAELNDIPVLLPSYERRGLGEKAPPEGYNRARGRAARGPSSNKAILVAPEPVVHYTVGNNSDGGVVLRVGDYYATTLSMNTAGCRHLIQMLEAAIQEEDKVVVPA